MIKIYDPLHSDGFEFCHPVFADDFETIRTQINGEPRSATWRPIDVKLVDDDQGRRLKASDAPWLGSHALVLKREAFEALKHILLDNGEPLPLRCEGAELVVFNARLRDALNEEASELVRFGSGRVMMINRYEFHGSRLVGADLFKIPNLRVSPIFVSERFVEFWRKTGLQGLDFTPVWSGD